MKTLYRYLAFVSGLNASTLAQVAISGLLANPNGSDGNFEYIQLKALAPVDFTATPMSLVVANNGTAQSSGWAAGGGLTYKFDLTAGTVAAGDVFYVGGAGQRLNGSGSADLSGALWIRSLNTATTPGDGLGNPSSGGVLGNGGANADGVALFSGTLLTSGSAPIDAVWFGTGIGTAQVGGGTAGYELPLNDRYGGGKLQASSYLFPDPAVSGAYLRLAGTYDLAAGLWTSAREGDLVMLGSGSTPLELESRITLAIPEPHQYACVTGAALLAYGLWSTRRRGVASR